MKLLMLKGLPASGKSTHAEELVKGGGNWVRVNKDLLRAMLHFDKWSGRNEKITVVAEIELARTLLETGHSVIVDDTNMGTKHELKWAILASQLRASFETKEFDTDVETCIARDNLRDKYVGESVIKTMALQYGLVKPKKKWVLCDIDGTVANLEHRLHYVKGEGKKDWRGFFSEMEKDTLIQNTHNMLELLSKDGYEIIFVSARPEDYRTVTEDWLKANITVPWYTLIMRKKGDSREDSIVKKQILDTYFDKSDIHCVIDDRPRVLRMWEEQGLEVIDAGEGIEF